MNLADVMDELATALETVTGLRVFAWPPGSLTPPGAVVGYPSEYAYDKTYGRGSDEFTLPVVIVVGRATERTSRDALAAFVNPTGASSVKLVLESATYTSCSSVWVSTVDFDTYSVAGVEYLAAIFDVQIAGSGTA